MLTFRPWVLYTLKWSLGSYSTSKACGMLRKLMHFNLFWGAQEPKYVWRKFMYDSHSWQGGKNSKTFSSSPLWLQSGYTFKQAKLHIPWHCVLAVGEDLLLMREYICAHTEDSLSWTGPMFWIYFLALFPRAKSKLGHLHQFPFWGQMIWVHNNRVLLTPDGVK